MRAGAPPYKWKIGGRITIEIANWAWEDMLFLPGLCLSPLKIKSFARDIAEQEEPVWIFLSVQKEVKH
ncbi:hypothetical protein [Candidatus Odyssella thessalonicensis]|uniref:hypothetical protein n=1 Tax=Candidatus Odyssella thessalonicensis TaxID=84647 RepID=UPI000225B72C|nr:hypothetical protein [Candidatus Odyssella thessalonicensis]